VTELSAITARIGVLESSGAGQRFRLTSDGFEFYNSANVRVIRAAV